MIFASDSYARFLQAGAAVSRFLTFSAWTPDLTSGIFLRHDVDISLERAAALARMEAAMDIPATYFILLSAEAYNPLSPAGRRLVREIAAGHEIGLHFDPLMYPAASMDELAVRARQEADLLGCAAGRAITSLSPHNPSTHGLTAPIPGFLNAYAPELFEDARYLSDARMEFRGKNPMAWIAGAAGKVLQASLHPEHFGPAAPDYRTIFGDHAAEMLNNWDAHFRPVNAAFGEAWPHRLRGMLALPAV